MAEPMKIEITVAGRQDLNDLIKKVNEGTASLSEMRTVTRELKKIADETAVNTRSFEELSAAVARSKDITDKFAQASFSSNAKMMRDYFTLGRQLRAGLLPLIDGLPSAFRPLVSAIDNASMQLQLMSTKGIDSMTALRTAFTGPLGLVAGIGLAITALTFLIQKLNDTTEAQKNLESQMDQFNRRLRRMTIEQAQAELETTERSLKEMQAAKGVTKKGVGIGIAGSMLFGWLADLFTSTPEELDLRIKAAEERIKKLREFIEEEDAKLVDKTIQNEKKLLEEKKDVAEKLRKAALEDASEFTTFEQKFLARVKKTPPKGPQPSAEVISTPVDVTLAANARVFASMTDEFGTFEKAVLNGVMDLSSIITRDLAGAWRTAFGEANSIAEQFFLMMTQRLAQLALEFALAFALDQVIPGAGKFLGFDFAKTSSNVAQTAASPSRRGLGQEWGTVRLEAVLRGSDIYIAAERGKSQVLTRSMR